MCRAQTAGTCKDSFTDRAFVSVSVCEAVGFCILVLKTVTMAGDGYKGRMSPHTPNEKFEGASVLKTLQVNTGD